VHRVHLPTNLNFCYGGLAGGFVLIAWPIFLSAYVFHVCVVTEGRLSVKGPFLKGVVLDSFFQREASDSDSSTAHSIYLESRGLGHASCAAAG
jgi:hypothetical protein